MSTDAESVMAVPRAGTIGGAGLGGATLARSAGGGNGFRGADGLTFDRILSMRFRSDHQAGIGNAIAPAVQAVSSYAPESFLLMPRRGNGI